MKRKDKIMFGKEVKIVRKAVIASYRNGYSANAATSPQGKERAK